MVCRMGSLISLECHTFQEFSFHGIGACSMERNGVRGGVLPEVRPHISESCCRSGAAPPEGPPKHRGSGTLKFYGCPQATNIRLNLKDLLDSSGEPRFAVQIRPKMRRLSKPAGANSAANHCKGRSESTGTKRSLPPQKYPGNRTLHCQFQILGEGPSMRRLSATWLESEAGDKNSEQEGIVPRGG